MNIVSANEEKCQAQVCAGSRLGNCVWPQNDCQTRGIECVMKAIVAEEQAKENTEARRALRALDGALRTLAASRATLARVLGDRAA